MYQIFGTTPDAGVPREEAAGYGDRPLLALMPPAAEEEMVERAELVAALVEMATPDKDLSFEGDGVSHPMVYTLRHPIKLTSTQDLTQFEFSARTLGQISGFLNAEGEVASFREFMRGFSAIVGVPMPVTDSIVDALDIQDYANVKEHIMGKLTKSRGRLKRQS